MQTSLAVMEFYIIYSSLKFTHISGETCKNIKEVTCKKVSFGKILTITCSCVIML